MSSGARGAGGRTTVVSPEVGCLKSSRLAADSSPSPDSSKDYAQLVHVDRSSMRDYIPSDTSSYSLRTAGLHHSTRIASLSPGFSDIPRIHE